MVVSDEALRPFRSRRGRLVATVMAVVSLLVFGAIAVLLPTNAGLTTWQPVDRLSVAGLGVLIALACWRYATIRAVPSLDGLVVRNLVVTRTLTWAQVVDVECVVEPVEADVFDGRKLHDECQHVSQSIALRVELLSGQGLLVREFRRP